MTVYVENEMEKEKAAMRALLAPLINQARVEKTWLYCSYQNLWFSPRELEKEHAEGKFLWSLENWSLRAPSERVSELARETEEAAANFRAFLARLKQELEADRHVG